LVGRESGAVPEGDGHLFYQVVSDEHSERVRTDRDALDRLQRVLEWKPFYGPEKVVLPQMPEHMLEAVKKGLASEMISTWTQLRKVETVLDEMALGSTAQTRCGRVRVKTLTRPSRSCSPFRSSYACSRSKSSCVSRWLRRWTRCGSGSRR
jgi:hypothetical protein